MAATGKGRRNDPRMTEDRMQPVARPTSETRRPVETSTRADLLQLINGFKMSQAVQVAATLGIADLLSRGPQSIEDIAAATCTEPNALYRLMRVLAARGVFAERLDREFGLTPMGELLRCDVPGSLAFMAQLSGQSSVWQAWTTMLHSLQTGDPAFDHVHGCSIWDFRRRNPVEGAIFDRAMALGTERYADAALDAYDFGRFQTIVDLGGGDGAFLGAVLARYPYMRGTLFDQPHVIGRSTRRDEALVVGDRCVTTAGDFFVSVPEKADAYLLKWILHDWGDAAAINILRTCHRAMKSSSKLIVIEHVIEPPNSGIEGKLLDLTMMIMNGGRERTQEEFLRLVRASRIPHDIDHPDRDGAQRHRGSAARPPRN